MSMSAAIFSAATTAASSLASGTLNEYALPFDASWTPDLWGRVRKTVLVNVFGAQATAADLATSCGLRSLTWE